MRWNTANEGCALWHSHHSIRPGAGEKLVPLQQLAITSRHLFSFNMKITYVSEKFLGLCSGHTHNMSVPMPVRYISKNRFPISPENSFIRNGYYLAEKYISEAILRVKGSVENTHTFLVHTSRHKWWVEWPRCLQGKISLQTVAFNHPEVYWWKYAWWIWWMNSQNIHQVFHW